MKRESVHRVFHGVSCVLDCVLYSFCGAAVGGIVYRLTDLFSGPLAFLTGRKGAHEEGGEGKGEQGKDVFFHRSV